MNVALGKLFAIELQRYPEDDRKKILSFVIHLKINGFNHLQGRNKFSDDIDWSDPNYTEKSEYVKLHCLWHYHIGIEKYDTSKKVGDWTSEYVIHYCRPDARDVKIVDFSAHPPFRLPTISYME